MDPYLAYKEGGLMAVAVLLFVANFIQNFGIKKSNEILVDAVRQTNLTASKANEVVADRLTDLAQTLADGQEKMMEGLTTVIKNQEVLATQQLNLTHTSNEVVRELITIIRNGERS